MLDGHNRYILNGLLLLCSLQACAPVFRKLAPYLCYARCIERSIELRFYC